MKLNEMLGRHFIGKFNGCVPVPYADITGGCPPDIMSVLGRRARNTKHSTAPLTARCGEPKEIRNIMG